MHKLFTYFQNILRNKRLLLVLAGIALLVWLIPEDVHAESIGEKTGESLAYILNKVLLFLDKLVWLFLFFIGDLMDSDLIIGPGMEDRLLEIWSQVRNLVNIGFVVVLLVIAFYNVTGFGGEGDYAIKTALPKLILGLILVNFTYLGGKILVDISAIMTNAAFALPELVSNAPISDETDEFLQHVCYKNVTIEDGAMVIETYEIGGQDVPQVTKIVCKENETAGVYMNEFKDDVKSMFSRYNASNIGLLMAVNHGALTSLPLIEENVNDFGDLIINSIFSIILFFVFSVSYIVLGIMLVFRIVILWVGIALSPLLVLFWVVPQLKEAGGGELDITTKVTKHLLAPITIGVVMTIGSLMIQAMDDVVGGSALTFSQQTIDEYVEEEVFLTGIGDLQQILIAIASIVVIWVGIFGAASDTFAGEFVGGIRGFGESAGKFVSRLPLYAQVVPISTGGSNAQPVNVSLGALGQFTRQVMDTANSGQMFQGDVNKIRNTFPTIDNFLSGNDGNTPQALLQRSPSMPFNELRDQVMSFDIDQSNYREMAQLLSRLVDKNPNFIGNKERVQEQLERAGEAASPQQLLTLIRDQYPNAENTFGVSRNWVETRGQGGGLPGAGRNGAGGTGTGTNGGTGTNPRPGGGGGTPPAAEQTNPENAGVNTAVRGSGEAAGAPEGSGAGAAGEAGAGGNAAAGAGGTGPEGAGGAGSGTAGTG